MFKRTAGKDGSFQVSGCLCAQLRTATCLALSYTPLTLRSAALRSKWHVPCESPQTYPEPATHLCTPQVKPEDCSKVAESYTAWALQQVAEDAKEALARVADTVFDEEEIGSMPAQTYEVRLQCVYVCVWVVLGVTRQVKLPTCSQPSARSYEVRWQPPASQLPSTPRSVLHTTIHARLHTPPPLCHTHPQLPDGTELSIGSDRFKVAETLFNSVSLWLHF